MLRQVFMYARMHARVAILTSYACVVKHHGRLLMPSAFRIADLVTLTCSAGSWRFSYPLYYFFTKIRRADPIHTAGQSVQAVVMARSSELERERRSGMLHR
jgi:hypothetical protein